MKRILLSLLIFVWTIPALSQTEYYLNKAITVGCYGANALTDISKKAWITIDGEKAVLKLKSMNCTKEKELNKISVFEADGIKDLYYSSKDKVGVFQDADDIFFIFKKDGSSYDIFTAAALDKKVAKEIDFSSKKSKYGPSLSSIDDALKAQKEKEEELAQQQKEEEERKKREEELKKQQDAMGEMYKAHLGKILFVEKYMSPKNVADDKQTDFVNEFELGNDALYARAYLTPEFKGTKGLLDIRFTIGDESVSSEQLRHEYGQEGKSRYASVGTASYWEKGLVGNFPLVSAKKRYYGSTYSTAEDAFKILLARVKDKLTLGSSHKLKVELYHVDKLGDYEGDAEMTGEITMKITKKSENILSLLCRCQEPQKKDATIEKQIKELLLSDPGITTVHKVWLLGRDYEVKNSYGSPEYRSMKAQAIFTTKEGWVVTWRGSVKYAYNGSGFSDIAMFHENDLYMPVSSTCIRGAK
jgi:hypothetical protein